MRYKIHPIKQFLIFSAILFFVFVPKTYSQISFCPPNIDFEQGNLSNWEFYTGQCCPLNASTNTGAIANRHVLTSGSGTDPYGGFPIVAYGGGSYSLRLGNNINGRQAERARYYIRVPNNQSDYTFVYRYAVVFEDPKHTTQQQPRFEIRAYDSITQAPLSCSQFTYISTSNLPGFEKSTVGTNVYFKPWTTATLDLSGYAGRTIALDFASGDCALGGHFGYGYIDVNCGLFKTKATFCNGDSVYTLNAPTGFEHYKWMDTSFTQVFDTTQTFVVNKSQAYYKYAIVVTPYQGFGCMDTFYTVLEEDTSSVAAYVTPTASACIGSQANPVASGYSLNPPLDYKWYPTTGVSCTWCKSPIINAVDTTDYYVVVSDRFGCKDTAKFRLNILYPPKANLVYDTIGCINDSVTITAVPQTTYSTFSWSPTVNMTGANTLTPKIKVISGTLNYSFIIRSMYGCADTEQTNMIKYPKPLVGTNVGAQGCPGDSTSINGSVNLATTYEWKPHAGLSDPFSINTKAVVGMVAKAYHLVAVTNVGCKDSSIAQVIPIPTPVADAGNDTAVCKGTRMQLHASSGGLGNCTYEWSPANLFSPGNTTQSPFITVDTVRTYSLVITSQGGCADTTDITIGAYPKPVADAGPDTNACTGVATSLQGASSELSSYFWYPPAVFSKPFAAATTATLNSSSNLTLIVMTTHGCKDTDDVFITINPQPVANAGPDTGMCAGNSVRLHGSGGLLYNWTPNTDIQYSNTDTPIVAVLGNKTYYLKVTNQYGCHDTDDVAIVLYPNPVADAGPDTAVCKGEKFTFNGSGGISYYWYPNTNIFLPYLPNPTVYVDKTSTYYLQVTNVYGCHDTDDIIVSANPLPIVDAGPDKMACLGDSVVLNGKGGGAYEWTPALNLNNANTATPVAYVYGTSIYKLKVTNSFNCTDEDAVTVSPYPQPVAVATGDTSVCPGADINLYGSGGIRYTWLASNGSAGSNTASIKAHITQTVNYMLVVADSNNCKDTTTVTVDTIAFITGIDTPAKACAGTDIQLAAFGGDRYEWTPAAYLDNPDAQNPVAVVNGHSLFTVYITDGVCMRTDTLQTQAEVYALPDLKVAVKDFDCGSAFGYLKAEGAEKYSWSPSTGLDNPNAAYTTAVPSETTVYTLTGTDSYGCVDTVMRELKVFQGDGRLFIPNAFTPNGDGVNDCYRVIIPGDVIEFDFSIYNRFGERVFHATQRDHCWDGTYKGVRAELSTYYYYYTATSTACGKVFRKGDMHLLR